MLPVPPKEAITPRRKQSFYEFAQQVYNYGLELSTFRESNDFENLNQDEKDVVLEELSKVEKLNEFQVSEIDTFN